MPCFFLETGLLILAFIRLRRQHADLRTLLNLVRSDRNRIEPAARHLADLLSDIANASAQGGESVHMLSKRLNRILTTPRGEGRAVKDEFLILANLYDCGLLTWLEQRYPGLNRNEIAICGMITLGLDPICIDKVFGYDHEQTFYNRRADIRRKLGLDRSVPLERFLTEQAARLRREHEAALHRIDRRY